MLGNLKKEKQFLITVPEILKLFDYTDMQAAILAGELEAAMNNKMIEERDKEWRRLSVLTIVFEAGRLQGIREERERRRSANR